MRFLVLAFLYFSLITCYQHNLHQYRIPRLNLPFTDEPRYYAPERKTVPAKTIPLCEYWKILGVRREECQEEDAQDETQDHGIFQDDYHSDKRQESYETDLPMCRLKFLAASCVKSSKCPSGIVCLDFSTQRCCHPMPGTCPTPAQLGYKCMVYTPISWCSTNKDCKGKKCCPTGCDYNVCV